MECPTNMLFSLVGMTLASCSILRYILALCWYFSRSFSLDIFAAQCLTLLWFTGRHRGNGAVPHSLPLLRIDHVRYQLDISLQLSLLSGGQKPVYARYVGWQAEVRSLLRENGLFGLLVCFSLSYLVHVFLRQRWRAKLCCSKG